MFSYNKVVFAGSDAAMFSMPIKSLINNILKPTMMAILLSSFLYGGCSTQESPKKVSLYKRSGSHVEKTERPQPNTLWFGFDMRLGPKEEVMIYTSFLKYLETATGKRFRIKFAGKYEDTVKNLGRGVTDFAAIGSLSFVIGEHDYGIRYLVSGVNREGDPRYHSVIFTKPESTIYDLNDLRGKCFAFGSKISTQGHLIPRKMLEDDGISLDDLDRYIYTGSHINAVKSILNGECDAGGIQDTLATRLVSDGTIKVLKMSKPYPSSVIAYNSALDSKTVNAVRTALLAFDPNGRHQSILIDWDKTGMPMGFAEMDELELKRVSKLALKYGLLKQ